MNIDKKIGSIIEVPEEFKAVLGEKMTFYSISLKYLSEKDITMVHTFRKSTQEETEEN